MGRPQKSSFTDAVAIRKRQSWGPEDPGITGGSSFIDAISSPGITASKPMVWRQSAYRAPTAPLSYDPGKWRAQDYLNQLREIKLETQRCGSKDALKFVVEATKAKRPTEVIMTDLSEDPNQSRLNAQVKKKSDLSQSRLF